MLTNNEINFDVKNIRQMIINHSSLLTISPTNLQWRKRRKLSRCVHCFRFFSFRKKKVSKFLLFAHMTSALLLFQLLFEARKDAS